MLWKKSEHLWNWIFHISTACFAFQAIKDGYFSVERFVIKNNNNLFSHTMPHLDWIILYLNRKGQNEEILAYESGETKPIGIQVILTQIQTHNKKSIVKTVLNNKKHLLHSWFGSTPNYVINTAMLMLLKTIGVTLLILLWILQCLCYYYRTNLISSSYTEIQFIQFSRHFEKLVKAPNKMITVSLPFGWGN